MPVSYSLGSSRQPSAGHGRLSDEKEEDTEEDTVIRRGQYCYRGIPLYVNTIHAYIDVHG